MGCKEWKESVLDQMTENDNVLVHALLDSIEKERKGDSEILDSVCKTISSFGKIFLILVEIAVHDQYPLEYYSKNFETLYISSMSDFYHQKSSECISSMPSPEYVNKVIQFVTSRHYHG